MVAREDDGRVRGAALAYREGASGVKLQALAVDPDLRRHGIGSQLLEQLETAAVRSGSTSIYFGAERGARAFYGSWATRAPARSCARACRDEPWPSRPTHVSSGCRLYARLVSCADPGPRRPALVSSVPDVSHAAIEETQMIYDTVAATYAELIEDTSFEAGYDLAMINHFLRQVGINRGAHVLDAECGAGRMMTYLQQLDPSVRLTGVDLSAAMVEIARKSHPDRPIESGDLAALPCADGQFDGLLSWYSIIHTPTAALPDIVAEFRRVLRPGGSLLVAFHAGAGKRTAQGAYGHDVQLRSSSTRSTGWKMPCQPAGSSLPRDSSGWPVPTSATVRASS